jgi:hypothetical protein
MSSTGTPSVIAHDHFDAGVERFQDRVGRERGGTKIIVASAPVFSTASSTVSKTGSPSTVSPPLPGVTPPTIFVPYSLQCGMKRPACR